jgi:hypothetical protein
MSVIICKDSWSLFQYNKSLVEIENEKHQRLLSSQVQVVNSPELCLVCRKSHAADDDGKLIKFEVHHIKYFPQVIGFVHRECHKKIHDPVNPLTTFIQYEKGDSWKFYNPEKQMEVITA